MNQVIAEMVQSRGNPFVLDKMYLPYPNANAGPAAKFGFGCELYLPDVDGPTLREYALHFLLDFQKLFPQCVNEFLSRDAHRTVRITNDLEARIRADFEKHPVDTGYSTSLFGAVDMGLLKDDIPPYQAHVLLGRAGESDLSFVSAHMPVCNEEGRPDFEALSRAVLRWSSICRPAHGTAGLSLTFASGMQQNTKYALQLLKRFPGFDLIDGVDFSMEAGVVHNRIKCVNWLTVLDDKLVGELGGKDDMQGALQPACGVYEYPGGVVIQAGENPQLGDAVLGDIPQAYRTVAHYTKAIRFEDYKGRLFRVPEGLDKTAETLAWVRRFD
jgi:Protein of unknown function (DUF3396)